MHYGIDANLFDWSDEHHRRLPAEALQEPLRPVRREVP
jgi:hypothetical protein